MRNQRKPATKEPEEVNLWNQILAEKSQSQQKLGKSSLILLGNSNAGKRTLVKKL